MSNCGSCSITVTLPTKELLSFLIIAATGVEMVTLKQVMDIREQTGVNPVDAYTTVVKLLGDAVFTLEGKCDKQSSKGMSLPTKPTDDEIDSFLNSLFGTKKDG